MCAVGIIHALNLRPPKMHHCDKRKALKNLASTKYTFSSRSSRPFYDAAITWNKGKIGLRIKDGTERSIFKIQKTWYSFS